MKEYHLFDLPVPADLTKLQIRDWKPGRQYVPGEYVVVDGHPYPCKKIHVATMDDRPGMSALWRDCWTRAPWKSSTYYITSGGHTLEYLSGDGDLTTLTVIGGGGGGSDPETLARLDTVESSLLGKAEQSALTALDGRLATVESAVAGKASQAALDDLSAGVVALESELGTTFDLMSLAEVTP